LFLRYYFLALVGVLSGCSHSGIAPETENPEIPASWARGDDQGSVNLNWLQGFEHPQLQGLVVEAIANNYALAQEQARLYQAEQTVVITRADRWPSLDGSFNASRRKFEVASATSIASDSFSASLGARWNIDIWGRLNKTQQAAQLALAAQLARTESVERSLAATATGAIFGVIATKQLLGVARRRLDNALESRAIVASGYRQGLNDSLDLYLARNQVERESANYAQAEQTNKESIAALQLTLARYPDGNLEIGGELPVIDEPLPAGMPSELLTRRSDIQEAWLKLLAADARLAAAHKARFPSLSLVGSEGLATSEFADLLDGNGSARTLAVNLTQPLFGAGRLRALEKRADGEVQLAEQQYLDLVFRAFADVENALSRAASLQLRYTSFLDAEKNSRAALELALEQYQRGLVSYTTVLESQRQAFDAEATVVQLRNQLLQNRISLFLSLGGEFSTDY
jgi:NodT family efflux transporter outer membrane factor (OMF) lipoprotein